MNPRAVCALALALACASCGVGGYNNYATPRTTPKGKLQGGLHLQGVGFAGEIGGQNRRVIMPTLPSFAVRRGFSDSVDVGLRMSIVPITVEAGGEVEMVGDLRLRIVDGEAIEIALGPGARYAYLWGVETADDRGYFQKQGLGVWTLDAPIITGINFTETLALVLSTGIVYDIRAPDTNPYYAAIDGRFARGLSPRVALGLHDDSGRFSMNPEASLVFVTAEPDRRVIYTVGLAFQFRWWRPKE